MYAGGATVGDAGMILVTSVEASAWTGRPPGTIWRWASEGRINRYRAPSGVTKYNLAELPAKGEDGRPAPAPPLPHNRPEEVVPV